MFNEDGSIKKLHLSRDCPYHERFPDACKYYASLFEDVIYSDGNKGTWKLATIITYSIDDMLEAFKELGIEDKRL